MTIDTPVIERYPYQATSAGELGLDTLATSAGELGLDALEPIAGELGLDTLATSAGIDFPQIPLNAN